MITLQTHLKEKLACGSAVEWAKAYDSPQKAWADCHRVDWMLWWVTNGGLELDEGKLRLFACDCAERALDRIEKPDPRSIAVLEVVRRFVSGEASLEEMNEARDAAAAYAYAAAAADAYAYAAAAADAYAYAAAAYAAAAYAAAAYAAADAAAYAAAAYAAADAAAYAAAYAAERKWQADKLREYFPSPDFSAVAGVDNKETHEG